MGETPYTYSNHRKKISLEVRVFWYTKVNLLWDTNLGENGLGLVLSMARIICKNNQRKRLWSQILFVASFFQSNAHTRWTTVPSCRAPQLWDMTGRQRGECTTVSGLTCLFLPVSSPQGTQFSDVMPSFHLCHKHPLETEGATSRELGKELTAKWSSQGIQLPSRKFSEKVFRKFSESSLSNQACTLMEIIPQIKSILKELNHRCIGFLTCTLTSVPCRTGTSWHAGCEFCAVHTLGQAYSAPDPATVAWD